MIRINIGCGSSPSIDWLNFDNTPALKLANAPGQYRIARSLGILNERQIENIEWNKKHDIRYADATKRIPVSSDTVDAVYTSHMLEHLSREGALLFLHEAKRALKNGGVLRVSVPDLKKQVEKYSQNLDADDFMNSLLVEAPPLKTWKQKVLVMLAGYRHHQWMYDGTSLSRLFSKAGLKNVKICAPGETTIADATGLDLFERASESVVVEGEK